MDLVLPLVEGGYQEEFLWKLPYSALKRRAEARRRLVSLRRIERMLDTRIGVNGEADDVKAFIADQTE